MTEFELKRRTPEEISAYYAGLGAGAMLMANNLSRNPDVDLVEVATAREEVLKMIDQMREAARWEP